jgi:tripartite-type tricarboxylate transporter receptor subunit TctC
MTGPGLEPGPPPDRTPAGPRSLAGDKRKVFAATRLGRGGRMMRAKLFVSIAILMAWTASATAQDYPNRLIKLMHGFPAGGNVDVLARIMAEEMSKGLGQPIVIEAKPGVVGSLAAETIARSPADGYTLFMGSLASNAVIALLSKLSFDPN